VRRKLQIDCSDAPQQDPCHQQAKRSVEMVQFDKQLETAVQFWRKENMSNCLSEKFVCDEQVHPNCERKTAM